jgi:hypothetical protein
MWLVTWWLLSTSLEGLPLRSVVSRRLVERDVLGTPCVQLPDRFPSARTLPDVWLGLAILPWMIQGVPERASSRCLTSGGQCIVDLLVQISAIVRKQWAYIGRWVVVR